MTRRGVVRIGVSGWRYPPWRGVFYPTGLPQRRELHFIGETFGTVEINGTFYGLQRPDFFEACAAEVPDDFVFAVKGSRFITHNKKLSDVEAPLANFLAQGLLRLGRKLGPILWQLPPSFRFDAERVERFLVMLPRDSDALARLARRHDERLRGRAAVTPKADIAVRHAMEIRHESFVDPQFIALLRKHGVALVCADSVEWPRLADVTSDFVYCRLHGSEELYASGYDDAALDRWADWVAAWAVGKEPKDAERVVDRAAPKRARRDVFVFFDNDAKVRAPYDALGLTARVEKRMGGDGAK
jgi:uncharacterized protein YecE (DUF72 family)